MEFIDGISVLYTDYISNKPIKIGFYALSAICIAYMIAVTILMVRDIVIYKIPTVIEGIDIVTFLAGLVIGVGLFFIAHNFKAQIRYTVQMDDTVPYTYVEENLPTMHHDGGNIYYFYIDEE